MMENKISQMMNQFNLEELTQLLDREIDVEIDSMTAERIKMATIQRLGHIHQDYRRHWRWVGWVAAAVLVVLLGASSFIGFDNVIAAVKGMFSFIPGYGIIENNDSIEYIVAELSAAENEQAQMVLMNAIATRDSITVIFEIERRGVTEEQLLLEKEIEWERLQREDRLVMPSVYLVIGESYLKCNTYSIGGGGFKDRVTCVFEVDPEDINVQEIYRLVYEEYDLAVDFMLKDYESFEQVQQIGPTDGHNDISITAVTEREGDRLSVELYPINRSRYQIYEYTGMAGYGYAGEYLHLESDRGIKSYRLPEQYGDAYANFVFELEPGENDLVLVIPYLLVQSYNETRVQVNLPIPPIGERRVINQAVEFDDAKMIIVDVEKIYELSTEEYYLRMKLNYESKLTNMVMQQANFWRTDFWGQVQGGGYSATVDSNGVMTVVEFLLEPNDGKTLRLQIANPIYYMIGEYRISLSE